MEIVRCLKDHGHDSH